MSKDRKKKAKFFNLKPEMLFLALTIITGLTIHSSVNGTNILSSLLATDSRSTEYCAALESKASAGDLAAAEDYAYYCVEDESIKEDETGQDEASTETEASTENQDTNNDEVNSTKTHVLVCKEMEQKAKEGDARAKEEFTHYCKRDDQNREPVQNFCMKFRQTLADGSYSKEEKERYMKVCNGERPTGDACAKLSGEGTDEQLAKLCSFQPRFEKGSSFCEEAKANLDKWSVDTTSPDYSIAKQKYVAYCEKQVPPAGYEDEVITLTTEEENPFGDTALDTLEGKAAFELYRRAVIGGFSDGTFRGKDLVNRAQLAKFLTLARYGNVEDVANDGKFPDVKNGEWYVRYIVKSSQLGIMNGDPSGKARPGDPVNTAEFLKMLSLTFGLETDLPYTYTDVNADHWAAKYLGIAEKYKLFPERTTEIHLESQLTRKEVTIAIYQYLSNREEVTSEATES